jgi:ADP-ribosyl-[dinitrogen reductase] hydrolase
VILNPTIDGLLNETNTPLRDALTFVGSNAPEELVTALNPLACGGTPATLRTSGYVVYSLQTALHDGLFAESAEDTIVTTLYRGGDTDTIGATAGVVAGERFGASALPDQWLAAVDEIDELETLADQLTEHL